MQPVTARFTSADVVSNLVFWYRDHGYHFEAEYETRNAEKFSVKFFRPASSQYLFNHAHLPEVVVIEQDIERKRAISLVMSLARTGIPVILYSGKYSRDARTKAISWGLDEYLFGSIGPDFWNQVRIIRALKQHSWEQKKQRGSGVESVDIALPAFKNYRGKRAFDIIASSLLILALSPFLLLIALLIKLESRGPIIYKSKRAGTGYKIFDFYKFRSMRVGADKELAALSTSNNQYANDSKAQVFHKIQNDPRVTRFGKILRKTSLDELPQLINVLIGDMSLVGNRPLPLYEAEMLTKDGAAWRFLAPAGITGLWQITKRGKKKMSVEERIELDATYARNYSIWIDIKILAATFMAMIQEEKV